MTQDPNQQPQQQPYGQPQQQPYAPPPQPYYAPQPAANMFHAHGDIVQRFVALLIDGIILFIIYIALSAVLFFAGIVSAGLFGFFSATSGAIILSLLFFVIMLIYFVIQEGGPANSTIGKSAMSLKVTDEQYRPIGMDKALLRNIFRAIWSLPFVGFVLFIVDVVLVLVRPDRQRLGDIIAHTYVVRQDIHTGPHPYQMPAQQQYQPPQNQPPPQQQAPPPQQGQYGQPPAQQQYAEPPPQQPQQQQPLPPQQYGQPPQEQQVAPVQPTEQPPQYKQPPQE